MPRKTLHICFVAPNAYPILAGDESVQIVGGAELQQVLIAQGLTERGYRVTMICRDFGQGPEAEVDGIKCLGAYRPGQGLPMVRFIWPNLTGIWRCMKRANADIYYQRCAGMLTGVVAEFCRQHGRKSVFAAAHNNDLEKNTRMIRYSRDRWIFEYGLRRVDRIFVQNEEQRALCRANFGRDSTLIPNLHPKQTSGSFSSGNYVLWVSTIRARKRPDIFLDLAAALPEYQFRMIGGPGNGEADLFESIKNRAQSMANVEFKGFVPYVRVEEHFAQASVLVNTSEAEGFPNTFLQAWARAIPTVSFFDCGARDNGEPVGIIVKTFDELVGSLAALHNNPSRSDQLGIACRAHFEMYHSPERISDLYEQEFSNMYLHNS